MLYCTYVFVLITLFVLILCMFIFVIFVVCPASKPLGITYNITSNSSTTFSANISWIAPNNTYQHDITKYIVIVGHVGDELDGTEAISDISKYTKREVCTYL